MADFSQIPDDWDSIDDQAWQAAPVSHPLNIPPQRLSLRGQCTRVFACACGAGGGFLAGHAGCIVSPVLAFMTAAGGGVLSAISVAASTTITGIGLAGWYAIRGRVARPMEKILTTSGAVTGAVMAASLHFAGVAGNHHNTEAALDWYKSQPEATRVQLADSAKATRTSLLDMVLGICTVPTEPNPAPKPQEPK